MTSVSPSGAIATIKPDEKQDCPMGPGIADSVSRVRYLPGQNLHVGFNEQAGFCLDKYFASPGGQYLAYNLTLCDSGWTPIPGWTINESWIQKFSEPPYISFTPLTLNNLGTYNFKVIATNGTHVVSDKVKITVYQFNNSQDDYQGRWMSYWTGALAIIGSLYGVIKTYQEAANNPFVIAHPNLVGSLVGLGIGAALGWVGELINISVRDTDSGQRDAYYQGWWIPIPAAIGAGIIGLFAVPWIVRRNLPNNANNEGIPLVPQLPV